MKAAARGPRDLNKTADVSSRTRRRKKDCSRVSELAVERAGGVSGDTGEEGLVLPLYGI